MLVRIAVITYVYSAFEQTSMYENSALQVQYNNMLQYGLML